MENTALKNVCSSEQIYKTSNGIKFKINHLIIKLNYDDVCFILVSKIMYLIMTLLIKN